jgi:(2Fe-2S) ferredoxin
MCRSSIPLFRFCEKGPIVKVLPAKRYVEVKPEDAHEIIAEQVIKGREVTRLLYRKDKKSDTARLEDIEFYQKQFRIVLRNCGVINPESIDEYIARTGYRALEKARFEMSRRDKRRGHASGLRGAAALAYDRNELEAARKFPGISSTRVQADEGDPGAYMDRSTIEVIRQYTRELWSSPSRGGLEFRLHYIRAEYPLAIERLKIAIQQAKDYGF